MSDIYVSLNDSEIWPLKVDRFIVGNVIRDSNSACLLSVIIVGLVEGSPTQGDNASL